MNLYRDTGNAMLALGISLLLSSIISLARFYIQGYVMSGSSGLLHIRFLQNIFLLHGFLTAINVAILVWLVYNSYYLGRELDVGSFRFGAIFILLAQLYSTVLTFLIYPQLVYIAQLLGSGGTITNEIVFNLLRLMSLMMIGALIGIIGYIIYGIGVMKIGDMLGSDNIKNGGLLIILGFIPLLGPIGLILSGYSLREFE